MIDTVHLGVFAGLMVLLALLTWRKVASARAASHAAADREIFLAGGGLSWFFVAGAITLTNLSTDQLVGMNGNQMLLLAWWALAGFIGLLMLAFVFVPIYYRNNCTTITQLLEQRYDGVSIHTVISALFLLGNLLIYLPAVIYSGALFMQTLFGVEASIVTIAALFAVVGAAYAILGGLRAVAVLDTYGGIGVLGLALVVVFLAMQAVGWDITGGVPAERLTMVGATDSPIPFHTLFTGMIFIQIFYWSTNQNITQKALAAPDVKEAQKGVIAAAVIRLLIVPPVVVIPGIVAFKLFGDVDDRAYAMVVGEVLPGWTSGMFAAMIAAAVLTTYAAVMNATITLRSVDFHRRFINANVDVTRLNRIVGLIAMVGSVALVPLYANATSIINLLQELNGLLSMPILSAFIAALLFRNMDARAAVAGLVWGFCLYAFHTFYLYVPENYLYVPENFGAVSWYATVGLPWVHYIDVMLFVLVTSVAMALLTNRVVFGNRATLAFGGRSPQPDGA